MNTCLMLRNSWGWGGVGWDVLTFVAHEHMFDATQRLGLGWGGMGCVNIRTEQLESMRLVTVQQIF